MALSLPLLPNAPLFDQSGQPTAIMQQYWQQFAQAIEGNVDAIAAALAAAVAAQSSADDAQNQAIAALTAATNAATAAATAQTTANGKLDQTAADARYVEKNTTPGWSAATGTASRSGFTVYASPTISNPPTTVEVQAVSDVTQTLSQHLKALIDDLVANGALT